MINYFSNAYLQDEGSRCNHLRRTSISSASFIKLHKKQRGQLLSSFFNGLPPRRGLSVHISQSFHFFVTSTQISPATMQCSVIRFEKLIILGLHSLCFNHCSNECSIICFGILIILGLHNLCYYRCKQQVFYHMLWHSDHFTQPVFNRCKQRGFYHMHWHIDYLWFTQPVF
jgi:hypothetical protein